MQKCALWSDGGSLPKVSHPCVVFPLGNLEVVDALGIGGLQACADSMCRFREERAAQTPGCIQLCGRMLAIQREWAPYPLGCPILVNLMLLRRDGWQHARVEVSKHDTLCSDKLIVNRDLAWYVWACQLGAYYQALMTMGTSGRCSHTRAPGSTGR